ncbi:MAG: DedA family protein [Patescibacteria group bacterium]
MSELINLLLEFSQSLGYPGIIILMTIESSFIPFPSEIVIPPAAYLASQGQMNIILVVISGILGSLIGATINYFLALYLGRAVVYKLADHKISNFLLINSKKIIKAENYFLQHGSISTFVGRFIPAVRQLISLPAGFSKMNFKKFIFFTGLGSGIWVIILAILGFTFGANQELMKKYYQEISLIFIGLIIILAVVLLIRKLINNKNKYKSR